MRTTKTFRAPIRTALLLLLTILVLSAGANAIETVSNGVYDVHVREVGDVNGRIGAWNAITGSAHDTGAGNDVIYRAANPFTSFSSLRVYRSTGVVDYTFGGQAGAQNLDPLLASEGTSPLAPQGQGWRTVWNVGADGLRVIQDVIIVGTTMANSAIYHTVEITNTGGGPVRIGWRNLYDWDIGNPSATNDAPANQLESTCGNVLIPATNNQFSHSPVTAQIARVMTVSGAQTYQPLLGLTFDPGFRSDLPVTSPDQYVYASWQASRNTAFDYPANNAPVTGAPAGDSAGLSWFGRDAARARTVPAGGSVRFTQVLFAQQPGGCLTPCLRNSNERILCSTDGSGNFTYTFTIRNVSQSPVHHLFLLNPRAVNDPSRQVSFSPSYLSFANSPLLPNGPPQTKTVVIQGAQPGDTISFLISGLDANQDECCAVERTITLPRCDCAQLLTESGPQCRFRPPGTYNYSFTLQNLFPGPVQYVLMTPSSGSGATFTPSSFTLNPILNQNGQVTLGTRLGNVTPGSQTCFRIGLHSPSFEHCCSIEKCVTPPRCTLTADDVSLVGNATFTFRQAGLLITGFGSGGQDGVSIATGEATGFDAEWLPIDTAALPNGAQITTTFQGTVDGVPGATIGTMKATKTGGSVEFRTDFSALGATRQRIEYYYQGELVNVVPDHPNAQELPNGGFPTVHRDVHAMYFGSRLLAVSYTFKVSVYDRHQGYVFDEFRVYPLNPTRDAGPLSNVLIQGTLLPSLTLTSANAQVEDTPSNDLNMVLNTGYNDATGTTLPLGTLPNGTADDDWRVVHTGAPAKLVIDQLPAWRTTLPGSRWISVNPNQGRSLPGVGTIGFERCFCLNAGATSAELDLRLFADDVATVLLNGQPIGGPGGQFRRVEPLRVQLTGAVGGGGPFRAGQNCLRIDVADRGVVTGLDLAGSIKAANGTCDLIP
jgi:hypothetical protein